MSLIESVKKQEDTISKFIDFDKIEKVLYNNLYMKDLKLVVKIPLNPKDDPIKKIKIEKFDLTKYCYLLAYD